LNSGQFKLCSRKQIQKYPVIKKIGFKLQHFYALSADLESYMDGDIERIKTNDGVVILVD
jgi:hypothetical protein